MDLTQRKLTKQEWESIEIPVSSHEKTVLKMIREGFENINIKHNNNQSLLTYAKLDDTEVMQIHIFNLYLKRLEKIQKNWFIPSKNKGRRKTSSKKARFDTS